jgi:hypothetical protein
LFGIILPISPDAQAFLDVSTDGVNYTTVESGYVQSYAPYDVSSLLAGSDEVFVRARLYVDDHGPIWAQFLRSAPYLKAPFVYDFEAAPAAVVPVPEPASVSLVALGAAVLVGVRRWRSRCCGSTAAVRGLTPLDVVCDG